MPESWASADEIATYLGVTGEAGYARIADRGMPAHGIGRPWESRTGETGNRVRIGAIIPGQDQTQLEPEP